MNKEFKIKVSDLLGQPWKIDEIDIKNMFSKLVPWLTKEWISGDLYLKSLDDNSVFAELENISCCREKPCERCQIIFEEKKEYPPYTSKFSLVKNKDELDDDAVFEIDNKENINLEDMITQNILLEDEIWNYCNKCKLKIWELDNDDFNQYDNVDDSKKWNIVFR